ncbi:MAG: hypothetical protein FWB93_01290 [Oscillospiraceae bacterium]|nr:hypothetical protein [Oscillospiraceae bacterium]
MPLNGEILSRDIVVATVENGVITSFDEDRLPMYLLRTMDVEGWLCSRAIDPHRTNSRLLKRALRIGSTDDLATVLRVHAATITDTYWFRSAGENLCYEDVKFKENQFASLALRGDPDSFNKNYSPTPELTNIGSYEKCWRQQDGGWFLVKRGSELERFSELLICRLGKALGFPMAEYFAEGDTVVSPDFTDGATQNFEPAMALMGDSEDYAENFEKFWELSPEIAKEYLQIIYMDALCFNMDRHTNNYGLLLDPNSGEVLSMAPNFDNNIALFARGIPANLARKNDKLIALYLDLLEQNSRANAIATGFPAPTREMLQRCVEETGIEMDDETIATACDFIMTGNEIIQLTMDNLQLTIKGQGQDQGLNFS